MRTARQALGSASSSAATAERQRAKSVCSVGSARSRILNRKPAARSAASDAVAAACSGRRVEPT